MTLRSKNYVNSLSFGLVTVKTLQQINKCQIHIDALELNTKQLHGHRASVPFQLLSIFYSSVKNNAHGYLNLSEPAHMAQNGNTPSYTGADVQQKL